MHSRWNSSNNIYNYLFPLLAIEDEFLIFVNKHNFF